MASWSRDNWVAYMRDITLGRRGRNPVWGRISARRRADGIVLISRTARYNTGLTSLLAPAPGPPHEKHVKSRSIEVNNYLFDFVCARGMPGTGVGRAVFGRVCEPASRPQPPGQRRDLAKRDRFAGIDRCLARAISRGVTVFDARNCL